MRNGVAARRGPASAVGAPGVADKLVHQALLYQDTTEFLDGTLSFVRDGLRRGEPVLVAVPRHNLDALRRALGPRATGVQFVDMTDAGRNPGRIIPWVLRAFTAEHEGRRTRIIGEPIWAGRTSDEYGACVQHEALINLALAMEPTTILCPYHRRSLTGAVLADAATTHPILVDALSQRPSDGYLAPERVCATFNRPLPEPVGHPVATMRFAGPDLAGVRAFVARHARQALPPDRVADLQLAVDELATNTITHGGGHGTLRAWRTAAGMTCEVRDSGHLSDPLAGRLLPDPAREHGRGLAIVNYLCDLVRVYAGADATVVRVQMLSPAAARAA